MTIRFLCPHGHKLAVPDSLAGKKGRCPVCQQRVYIPMLTSDDDSGEGLLADPPRPLTASARGATTTDEAIASAERALPPDGPAWSTEHHGRDAATAGIEGPGIEGPGIEGPGIEGPGTGRAGPPPIPGAPGDDASPANPPPLHGSTPSGDGPGAAPPAPPTVPGEAAPDPAAQELAVIIDEPEGYQADAGKVQTSYMLAMALGALTLLCAAPALQHLNLLEAPNWARVVLIASAVQLVFICWMVSLPDWSTVWICMVVFAFVAALYGVAWAVISFTPADMAVNFLDLDDPSDEHFRRRAAAWCFVMLMLATLLTYACGRFSGRWRKQYELAKAMRE